MGSSTRSYVAVIQSGFLFPTAAAKKPGLEPGESGERPGRTENPAGSDWTGLTTTGLQSC